jgi:hypothetical protein
MLAWFKLPEISFRRRSFAVATAMQGVTALQPSRTITNGKYNPLREKYAHWEPSCV